VFITVRDAFLVFVRRFRAVRESEAVCARALKVSLPAPKHVINTVYLSVVFTSYVSSVCVWDTRALAQERPGFYILYIFIYPGYAELAVSVATEPVMWRSVHNSRCFCWTQVQLTHTHVMDTYVLIFSSIDVFSFITGSAILVATLTKKLLIKHNSY